MCSTSYLGPVRFPLRIIELENDMFSRLRAPVNSFEFHRCRRTPQVECFIASASPPSISFDPTTSIHRLLRGLPGYLILCSIPISFRASASVWRWYAAFANVGVLRDIYAFHRYTAHSAYFANSSLPVSTARRGWSPAILPLT